MKLYVNTQDFSNNLKAVTKAVPGRALEPIFSHILMEVVRNSITLTGTDGQFTLKAKMEAEEDTMGEITTALPAREIVNLVTTFREPTLELIIENSIISINTGKSKYKLNCMLPGQYPNILPVNSNIKFTLKAKELQKTIKETGFAMAGTDEVRTVLLGSLLDCEGNTITIVAADGRRMALNTLKVDKTEPFKAILCRKTLQELTGFTGEEIDFIIDLEGGKVQVMAGNITLIASTIQGQFPNYKQLIPHKGEKYVINKLQLLQAVKRISLMAKDLESPGLVKFHFTTTGLALTANTQDVGEGFEELEIDGGPALSISFNGNYVRDMLQALDCELIEVYLTTCVGAGLWETGEGFQCILMPVRLKGEA